MSLLRPARRRQEELLDAGNGTPQEINQSLQDLRRINRLLGGHRVSLIALRRMIQEFSLPHFSFLDVATGSADLPLAVARWARRANLTCSLVGIDWNARHLAFGRSERQRYPEIHLVQGSVDSLPFRPASFDFVNVSLFLHHLDDAKAMTFLQSLCSLARIAVIVNDLERHWIPYFFLKLTQPVFARSPITEFDGFASLLQAFTREELEHTAHAARFTHYQVRRRFPYRLSLVVTKEEAFHARSDKI